MFEKRWQPYDTDTLGFHGRVREAASSHDLHLLIGAYLSMYVCMFDLAEDAARDVKNMRWMMTTTCVHSLAETRVETAALGL